MSNAVSGPSVPTSIHCCTIPATSKTKPSVQSVTKVPTAEMPSHSRARPYPGEPRLSRGAAGPVDFSACGMASAASHIPLTMGMTYVPNHIAHPQNRK